MSEKDGSSSESEGARRYTSNTTPWFLDELFLVTTGQRAGWYAGAGQRPTNASLVDTTAQMERRLQYLENNVGLPPNPNKPSTPAALPPIIPMQAYVNNGTVSTLIAAPPVPPDVGVIHWPRPTRPVVDLTADSTPISISSGSPTPTAIDPATGNTPVIDLTTASTPSSTSSGSPSSPNSGASVSLGSHSVQKPQAPAPFSNTSTSFSFGTSSASTRPQNTSAGQESTTNTTVTFGSFGYSGNKAQGMMDGQSCGVLDFSERPCFQTPAVSSTSPSSSVDASQGGRKRPAGPIDDSPTPATRPVKRPRTENADALLGFSAGSGSKPKPGSKPVKQDPPPTVSVPRANNVIMCADVHPISPVYVPSPVSRATWGPVDENWTWPATDGGFRVPSGSPNSTPISPRSTSREFDSGPEQVAPGGGMDERRPTDQLWRCINVEPKVGHTMRTRPAPLDLSSAAPRIPDTDCVNRYRGCIRWSSDDLDLSSASPRCPVTDDNEPDTRDRGRLVCLRDSPGVRIYYDTRESRPRSSPLDALPPTLYIMSSGRSPRVVCNGIQLSEHHSPPLDLPSPSPRTIICPGVPRRESRSSSPKVPSPTTGSSGLSPVCPCPGVQGSGTHPLFPDVPSPNVIICYGPKSPSSPVTPPARPPKKKRKTTGRTKKKAAGKKGATSEDDEPVPPKRKPVRKPARQIAPLAVPPSGRVTRAQARKQAAEVNDEMKKAAQREKQRRVTRTKVGEKRKRGEETESDPDV